jgi:chemotaxis protein histidine kinase CheA
MHDSGAFALLQIRSLGSLAVRFATLRGSISAARARHNEPEAADSLMRQFHSLAGIGGTYGFQHVSHLARAAELVCDPAAVGTATLSDDDFALLDAVVDALDHAGRSAREAGHPLPVPAANVSLSLEA